MSPIGCPETSVRNYITRCVITQKSAVLIYLVAESWNNAKNESKVTVYKLVQHYALIRSAKIPTFRWQLPPASGKTTPQTKKTRYQKMSTLSHPLRSISRPPATQSCLCHTSHVRTVP